jgi:pimeloyl-ACP methyl ester carboxylesterase
MSTLSGESITTTTQKSTGYSTAERRARRIGRLVIGLLAGLLVLISLLPVALLPLATAVPPSIYLPLAVIDAGLLLFLVRSENIPLRAAAVVALVAISILAVVLSQQFATTPAITGVDGEPLPGSIAELEAVELNGRQQWITIRGHDQEKPVLLFLAGGPGGSQLAATRKLLGELEKDFVVVNWDQPGAGKSYSAADFNALTPQQYIDDGHALTLYLRERFGEEKIYLLGESWGSLLGIWLVQHYPDQYHAFAGSAQMVAFLETDTYDYNLALQLAREQGDTGKVEALEKQGPPPYYGEGVAWPVIEYIMYLSSFMNSNPAITGPGYDTFGDIAAPEYGLLDKVNYVRGLLATMNALWPQLWDVDLRQDATRLDVPVYFFEGRHDVNAPPYLVEDYMQRLEAPHKELVWFEHSGHSPWVDEAQKVVDVLVNDILAQPAGEGESNE